MLVIGSGGAAKELLEVLSQLNSLKNLYFYDDLNEKTNNTISQNFPLLCNIDEVKKLFSEDNRFILGIGSPKVRQTLAKKFKNIGGKITTLISPKSEIGHFGTVIGEGVSILTNSIVTTDVKIESGVMINKSCIVSHDVLIKQYSVLSPGVKIMGESEIGENCFIGVGAIVLPKVKIGDNVTIGAGSIVTKDVPNNTLAIGIPAKYSKK